MSTAANIPDAVVARQLEASDPRASAWVAANAGSGKTYVLAQRVIRLLLDGVPPAKILCLTFTKAAAANMANRVFGTLAGWTALDDGALDAALNAIDRARPDRARRIKARRLFAETLETPGGLKVQTIHAFCTGLLHQFPFEADVAARFEVLEERAEAELIERLRMQVMVEASADPESPLGKALATAITLAADVTFAEAIYEAIDRRDAIEAWIERCGGVAEAADELARVAGVTPGDTLARVDAQFLDSPHLPSAEWTAAAAALAEGSVNDQKQAGRLRDAALRSGRGAIDAYVSVFISADGPRKAIVTGALQRKHPDLADRLSAEQARVADLLERRRAVLARDRTMALIALAHAVIVRYRAAKQAAGLLDYDDLIDRTLAMLNNVDAAWVHYKLDLGIDHVLIDEAQDTSPKQWAVIGALVAEFFAGEGARAETRRTIFAVGDEKQSIYSFQGAEPRSFDERRRLYERLHRDSDLPFRPVAFKYSFRSTPDVLGAVDAVFARPEALQGLSADPVRPVHEAVRARAPGHVDIWPLMIAEKQPDSDAWRLPVDALSETSPQVRLARKIATHVRTLIAQREILPLTGRPATPGDVLVLVRQRGPLFAAVIRALKDQRVEVAGADRLVLNEHIAVQDLLALGDALLLEQDDLALAAVLKSPLFGLGDDEDLFPLAHERTMSLRATLRARAGEQARWASAAATLDRWALVARSATPFAFYAGLLAADGGRRKMLARLGPEAADALDEFLALALDFEKRETPSLQGFVAWMRAAETEVKRDMDIGRNEVRVMTVHGAKGLEAPLVLLADTVSRPTGPRDPRLLSLAAAGVEEGARPLLWTGLKDDDVPAAADARAAARTAAEEEHRRLLYVAMTRAADRLIVCGARGVNAQPKGCWYDLVCDALLPEAVEYGAGDERYWRWQKSEADPVDVKPAAAASTPVRLPDWLHRDAPAADDVGRILTPSTASGVPVRGRRRPDADARAAIVRGQRVHRLLEALPDIDPARREAAARRFLARQPDPPDATAIAEMLSQIESVLSHARFAPLFAPGSCAEVPIVGRVALAAGAGVPVSGQIDRLAVTPELVLIADYKTDRTPPAAVADVSAAYVTQLALYRAVLGRLYLGRDIRAALVFTADSRLMEIPAADLDAAAAALGLALP